MTARSTAERCKKISQGYAFFAYPWKENVKRCRTLKGCKESSTPLQGVVPSSVMQSRGTQKTRTPG